MNKYHQNLLKTENRNYYEQKKGEKERGPIFMGTYCVPGHYARNFKKTLFLVFIFTSTLTPKYLGHLLKNLKRLNF